MAFTDETVHSRRTTSFPPEPMKAIRVTYESFAPGATEPFDRGVDCEELSMDPNTLERSDGITAAQKAVEYLKQEGASPMGAGVFVREETASLTGQRVRYAFSLLGYTSEEVGYVEAQLTPHRPRPGM